MAFSQGLGGCQISGKLKVEAALLECSPFGPSSQRHNMALPITVASSTACRVYGSPGPPGGTAGFLFLRDFVVVTRISYPLNTSQGLFGLLVCGFQVRMLLDFWVFFFNFVLCFCLVFFIKTCLHAN